MDRRTALAIGLMLLVALAPSILFPPEPPAPAAGRSDTLVTALAESVPGVSPAPRPVGATPPAVVMEPLPGPPADSADSIEPERAIVVESPLYRYVFSARGARLVEATLRRFETFAAGDSGLVQLIPTSSRFLEFGLVIGGDTISFRDWTFQSTSPEVVVADAGAKVVWTARRGGIGMRLEYGFAPDRYLFDVKGSIEGVQTGGLVLVGLGPRIAAVEADSVDDYRSYGVVTKAGKTERVKFSSLDPDESRALNGPFEWIAIKSKYFVTAVLALDPESAQFGGAVATGGARSGRTAVRTDVTSSLPAPGGEFGFSVYVGPQEFRRLKRIGHDFEDINPYGWILRPIIRPFANMIVVVLLWMHETLNLGYGWVLILFGLAVRVVLWPLNQKAMRSSMAMQAVQPEIKALQERYKSDPPKMQQELMKLYKEHKVNPLGGCLPLLLPMPVLFALFFVFRETIEFRGVPFLWLPDLSRADPLYVIPVLMGVSMFGLMKMGQRGVPPNPQTKMMLYIMPPFMTFIFLRFSAGLNLYYTVSNFASIPQQWLISQERVRRAAKKSK